MAARLARQVASEAVHDVRRTEARERKGSAEAAVLKGSCWALLKAPERLRDEERVHLTVLARRLDGATAQCQTPVQSCAIMTRITRQQSLRLPTWGGMRAGAGRKPAEGRREGLRHDRRERFRASQPLHVSMRFAPHVWNLRSERSFRIVDAALRGVRARQAFRVVHFSVLGNHMHVVAEADGVTALASGMRALSIRLARGLNRMMGRRGPVLASRYHAHVLRTPAEVRNAVRYVLHNFARHAARRGEPVSPRFVDRFSSAAGAGPRRAQLALFDEPATRSAETWLLRTARVG